MYEKVKALADEKKLSIAELERLSGLSNGTIGKWRDGKNGARLETVKAVAETLKVKIEDLI